MKKLTPRQKYVLGYFKEHNPTEDKAAWVCGADREVAMNLWRKGCLGKKQNEYAWDLFWYITDNPDPNFVPPVMEYYWIVPTYGDKPTILKVIGRERFYFRDLARAMGKKRSDFVGALYTDNLTKEVYEKCILRPDKYNMAVLDYTNSANSIMHL